MIRGTKYTRQGETRAAPPEDPTTCEAHMARFRPMLREQVRGNGAAVNLDVHGNQRDQRRSGRHSMDASVKTRSSTLHLGEPTGCPAQD
ncbi:unnamed protein product [Arctogadus glacialis]